MLLHVKQWIYYIFAICHMIVFRLKLMDISPTCYSDQIIVWLNVTVDRNKLQSIWYHPLNCLYRVNV
jgi:hypothetical protein